MIVKYLGNLTPLKSSQDVIGIYYGGASHGLSKSW